MKINIITYHWSNNLGALVQTLCLKKFLEKNFENFIEFNKYLPELLIRRERNSQINLQNFFFIFEIFKKKINLYNWKKNFES